MLLKFVSSVYKLYCQMLINHLDHQYYIFFKPYTDILYLDLTCHFLFLCHLLKHSHFVTLLFRRFISAAETGFTKGKKKLET